MRKILSQVLVTPTNYRRIAARIVPTDQRQAIRAGIIVSHYAFTTQQGQLGYGIISHTTRRAGLCLAERPSIWGGWSEQTGTLTTADGQVYNRVGELVYDLTEQGRTE